MHYVTMNSTEKGNAERGEQKMVRQFDIVELFVLLFLLFKLLKGIWKEVTVMEKNFYDVVEGNPVIAAIKDMIGLERFLFWIEILMATGE